jgi:hypothetical protein
MKGDYCLGKDNYCLQSGLPTYSVYPIGDNNYKNQEGMCSGSFVPTVRSTAENLWLECGVVSNAMPCYKERERET